MKKVIVCVNHRINPAQPSCAARGGLQLADRLEQEIRERNLAIMLERFLCLGRCEEGPNLKLAPGGKFCSRVNPDKLADVLQEIESFSKDAS